MYEFQSYSTAAQNVDALSVGATGKPQIPNPKPQPGQTCPATAAEHRQPRRALSATVRSLSQPPRTADVRRAKAPLAAPHRPRSAIGRASVPPSRDVLCGPGRVGQRPQRVHPPNVPVAGVGGRRRPATSLMSPRRRAAYVAQRQPPPACEGGQ